jgi:predicted nucleotidyltransferase
MNITLRTEIDQIKQEYSDEGFLVLGIFGSYARNEETTGSDIDILYELSPRFRAKYRGFDVFVRLEEIKNKLAARLGKPVDLADRNSLGPLGKKYILPETVFV